MRAAFVITIVLVLGLALAGAADAQKKGGNDAGGGKGRGGDSPGKGGSSPGHDPAGPGNSENAPGHDPDGPGNSENAHNQTATTNDSDEALDPATVDEPTPGKGRGDAREGNRDGRAEKDTRAEEARGKSADAPGRDETRVPPGKDKARADDAQGRNKDAKDRDEGGSKRRGAGSDTDERVLESTSAPPGQAKKAVHVREGDRDVEIARNDVEIASEGVSDPAQALLVIVHPNGTEELLADGATEARWNTSSYENGYYTVEVRERTSSGETMTVASTRVLVENPRVEAIAAVGAVATGAAVTAGAGMLAARGFDALSLLKQLAADAGGEAVSQTAEDKLRMKTANLAAVDWRRRSFVLLVAAGALLAFFKVFAAREEMLLALPIAFLAAFVYTVGDYAAEWALSRASGAQTRFRLWIPGALSLALSSLVFRAPFGYPGYVSETDVSEKGDGSRLRSRAGLRALAFMGAGIALTLPFLAVGAFWRWELAEYGVGVALMIGTAGAMPFSPMPGKDVWAWSRLAWLGVFAVFLALYVGWQIAMLPLGALVTLGIVGAVGFFFALEWLARTARAG